jgi:hypothetical protein
MDGWFRQKHTGATIDACFALLNKVIAEPRNQAEADEIVQIRFIAASGPDQLGHSFETALRAFTYYERRALSALGTEPQRGEGAQVAENRADILATAAALNRLTTFLNSFKPAPYKPPDLAARMSDSEPVFAGLLRRAKQDHSALRQSVKRYPEKIAQGKRAARIYGAVIEALAALPAELAAFCPDKLSNLGDVLKLADAIGQPIFAPVHYREPLLEIEFISRVCSRGGTADTALIGFCRPQISKPGRGCSYQFPSSGIRSAMERVSPLTRAIVTARALAHRLTRLRDPRWEEDSGATWCRIGTWLEDQII